MRWARVLAGLGVVLIVAAFALGTEVRPSADRDGRVIECGATISSSWLGDQGAPTGPPSGLERRTKAACAPHEAVLHGVVIGSFVVGALALLVGWTALREREAAAERSPVAV